MSLDKKKTDEERQMQIQDTGYRIPNRRANTNYNNYIACFLNITAHFVLEFQIF